MSNTTPALPTQQLASVGIRVGQFIIDALIAGLAGGSIGFALGSGDDSSAFAFNPLANLSGLLIGALFFVGVPLLSNGQTLGMILTKIKIVDAAGNKPGVGALLIRWILLIVDGILFGLVGFIIMNSRPDKQRLGDIAAKTYVVRAA